MLLAAFALYIVLAFFTDWRRAGGASAPEARARKLAGDGQGYVVVSLFLLILGFVALYVGARIVVDGSVALARSFQMPEALIALTVIALGTSLPELITTVVASVRGQSQLAIGHLIGSNIFNILAVLGTTAAIRPVTISPAGGPTSGSWRAPPCCSSPSWRPAGASRAGRASSWHCSISSISAFSAGAKD